jgi:hypothetical protein
VLGGWRFSDRGGRIVNGKTCARSIGAVAMNDVPTSSGPRRRAIVLIPGVRREERFFRRDTLVSNLETVESYPLRRGEAVEVAGDVGVRLTARPLRAASAPQGPDLDVFEAHWADMVPEQAELGPWQKLGSGLDMLAYWLLSWRTWRALAVSRYITLGLMAGGLLLVLWYVALVLVVADAVTKDYLENRPDETEVGLRDRMRNRVRTTLENVLEAGYDEVVLVAHSFGSVIAIDLLADWPHRDDFARLRLVTLGSPIAVLGYRSRWLDAERRQLLQRPELDTWLDFHAPTDWLCTSVPGHADRYRAMSRELDLEAPLRQMLTGQTHMLYYRSSEVLETLAAPLGEPGEATDPPAQRASRPMDRLPEDRASDGRAWPGPRSSRSRA